jgi:FkbM family methyltransferase
VLPCTAPCNVKLQQKSEFMIPQVKIFPSKLRRWLQALRSISGLSNEVRRLGAELPRLTEKTAQASTQMNANLREGDERFSALYESVAVRTALLEARIRHIDAEHGKLFILHQEAASRTAELEERMRLTGDGNAELAAQWDDLRKGLLSGIANGGGDRAVAPIVEQMTALFDRLTEQHNIVVAERDMLKNRGTGLLARLRQVTRQNTGKISIPKLSEPSTYLPLHVIDVGAQPLASEDHVYAALKATGSCLITGFEPLADKAGPTEPGVRNLSNFIGAGGPAVFHVAHFDPTSSLLEANLPFLRQFMTLADMCKSVSEHSVQTTRLDDIPEIIDCDFLKLDVQGGELDALRGADRLLERTVVVHTEVEFSYVYKNQPLFADVDVYLRSKGFELIDLIKFGHNPYAEMPSLRSASRLLWSDAIYFRGTDALATLGPQKLLRAAYIAHVNYGMWDLAAHILARYDRDFGSNLLGEYLAAVDR